MRAEPQERLRDREPDSAGAAGDENLLSVEQIVPECISADRT